MGQMGLKSTIYDIAHAEPHGSARPWFRVFNSLQGQSAYADKSLKLETRSGGELGFGVRDAQCYRCHSLVPFVL